MLTHSKYLIYLHHKSLIHSIVSDLDSIVKSCEMNPDAW